MNRSHLVFAVVAAVSASAAVGGSALAQSAAQVSPSPHPAPLEYRSRTRSDTPTRAAGATSMTPWLDEWARDRAERPVRDQEALDADANAAIADPDSGVYIKDAVGLSAQVRTVSDRVRQVQARDAVLRSPMTGGAPPVRRMAAVATPEPASCRDCLSTDLRSWARQRAWGPAGDAATLRAEAEAAIRAPWSGVEPGRQRDPALADALTAYLTDQMRQSR